MSGKKKIQVEKLLLKSDLKLVKKFLHRIKNRENTPK